jgi:hypothetical protein
LPAIKLPYHSGAYTSMAPDGSVKRRGSLEKLLLGNENKWDRRYHEQRAKMLQPVLDTLCNQRNAWQLPLLRRFLDLDSPANDIVSEAFFEAIEQVKRKLGIQNELVSNDKVEVLERLLFYRVEAKWKEIKSNCPGKPIKALAARSLHDILHKQARSWDDMATQFTLLQDKFHNSQSSNISDLFQTIQTVLNAVPEEVRNQADLLMPTKQFESILSSLVGSLTTEMQSMWDLVEQGLLNASSMLDSALDSPGSETISLLDQFQQVVANLRDTIATPLCGPRGILMRALQQISAEFPTNHDMAPLAKLLESHKRLPDILPVCLDAILAPARPVIDVIGEILVIRISLANIDVKQNSSRIDQVLTHMETTIRDRITDLNERLGADGQDILSKLRRRKTSASYFLGPLGEFLKDLAKIWPRFLKKVTFKFSDYVWVMGKRYSPDAISDSDIASGDVRTPQAPWRTAVGDAFAVACLKGYRYLMKAIKRAVDSMLRSYISSCLDSTYEALATMSKNPQYVGQLNISVPASVSSVLDTASAIQIVLQDRLKALVGASIDSQFIQPLSDSWDSLQTHGTFSELLRSRAEALREKDPQLWKFQQNTYRAGGSTNYGSSAAISTSPTSMGRSPGNASYFDRMMTLRNSRTTYGEGDAPPLTPQPAPAPRESVQRPASPIDFSNNAPSPVSRPSVPTGPVRRPAPQESVSSTGPPRQAPPRFARDIIEEQKRNSANRKPEMTDYGDFSLPKSVNPDYMRPMLDPFSRPKSRTTDDVPLTAEEERRFTNEKDIIEDPYESPIYRAVEEASAFDPTPKNINRISAVRLTMVNLDEDDNAIEDPAELFIFDGDVPDDESSSEESRSSPKSSGSSSVATQTQKTPTLMIPYVEPQLDQSYPLIERRKSAINPAYKNVFSFSSSEALDNQISPRSPSSLAPAPMSYIQIVPTKQLVPPRANQGSIAVHGPKKFHLPPPKVAAKQPPPQAAVKQPTPVPKQPLPSAAPNQAAVPTKHRPSTSPRPVAPSSPAKVSSSLVTKGPPVAAPAPRIGLSVSSPTLAGVKKAPPPAAVSPPPAQAKVKAPMSGKGPPPMPQPPPKRM